MSEPGILFGQKDFVSSEKRVLHVCSPTRGVYSAAMFMWMFNSSNWLTRCGVAVMSLWQAEAMPVDKAREHLANLVMLHKQQNPNMEHWVLWADDDMAPENGAVPCLLQSMIENPEIGVLSAFCSRKEDHDPGLIFHPHDGSQMMPGRDYVRGKIVEVQWCGLGFALHRAELFDKLTKPFFETSRMGASEDSYFTKAANEAGYTPYVHTGLVVGHVDTTRKQMFSPYIPPEIEHPVKTDGGQTTVLTQAPSNGKVHPAEYLCAFINCDDKDLFDSMATQFKEAPRVLCFDNGDKVGDQDKIVVLKSDKNIGWGSAFNKVMEYAVERGDVKAVWLCNDDIQEASPEKAKALYDTMLWLGDKTAAISPAVPQQENSVMPPQNPPVLRKVSFIDMVCPMMSVEAWKKIGPFDVEGIGWGHGLDVDWSQRAKDAGFNLYVDDRVVIQHLNPYTTCRKQGTMTEHAGSEWRDKLHAKYGKTPEEMVYG